MNESAFLKIMKNTINLDRPGVFCEKQPYDESSSFRAAAALRARGCYVDSFQIYLDIYREYDKLSLVWTRQAFQTLVCSGAIIDAYDLLTACTNYFIKSSNEKVIQLRIDQISIVLCILGYLGIDGYRQYNLNNYLADLSGASSEYVMPDMSEQLDKITVQLALLSQMNMYERQYPNLVEAAKQSVRSI